MNYVMTVQVSRLQVYHCEDGDEYVPKNVIENAFVFNDFDNAKMKFRETVAELTKNCKFFPLSKGKYKPLDEFCKDCECSAEDAVMIVNGELSKFMSDPTYFGSFPKETWGFGEHTFITKRDEVYYNIEGKILHSNAIEMTDAAKTYFFNYKDIDDYEPAHTISIFMKPIDGQ